MPAVLEEGLARPGAPPLRRLCGDALAASLGADGGLGELLLDGSVDYRDSRLSASGDRLEGDPEEELRLRNPAPRREKRQSGKSWRDYEIDDEGQVLAANVITPTAQNLANTERDLRKAVEGMLAVEDTPTDEQIKLQLEMVARAYDPCISCSAHFLDVEFVGEKE